MKKRKQPHLLLPILLAAFVFTSCDSMTSPESGNTDNEPPPQDSAERAPQFSWTLQESGTTSDLEDVHFVDSLNGWAVGSQILLHTSDGGQTWEEQQTPHPSGAAVHFVDSLTGWAVGGDVIQHTSDGGQTWQRQGQQTISEAFDDGGESLRDIHFVSADTGWAVASNIPNHFGTIFRTCDGGQTWQVQFEYDPENLEDGDRGRGLYAIHFANAREGWAVGESQLITGRGGSPPGARSYVVHTTDGGQTWSEEMDSSHTGSRLWDVQFITPDTGWMIGKAPSIEEDVPAQTLSLTTDGGENWSTAELGEANALDFASPDTGWAVGWQILHSTDGGNTWDQQENPAGEEDRLQAVSFTDNEHGWAVGRNGTIVHYTREE